MLLLEGMASEVWDGAGSAPRDGDGDGLLPCHLAPLRSLRLGGCEVLLCCLVNEKGLIRKVILPLGVLWRIACA